MTLNVHGRRITLRASEEIDGAGQFLVSVTVDGALTGEDTEVWSAHLTQHAGPHADPESTE